MWRRAGVILVWILATIGTASITLAAVTRVGGEVTNRPAVPVAADDLVLASTVPTTTLPVISGSGTSDGTDPVGWVSLDSTTTSVAPDAPVASAPPSSPGATASPAAPAPVTTNAPATQAPVTTVLVGGTVTVQQAGTSLTLISAVPASGFTADVEASGPSQVQVEFKSPSHESKYSARIEAGQLSVSTAEGEDD